MDIKLKDIDIKKFYYNDLNYDYIFNFSKLGKYYHYDYQDIKSYEKRASDITSDYHHNLRPKVCDILKSYNFSLGCDYKTIENIDKLLEKSSVVVIGGQQPGLFASPLFIIYKILTILKVSNFLEEKLNIKAVPVFWNASDDSNLKYIKSFNILNQALHQITLDTKDIKKGMRFSDIFFPLSKWEMIIEDIGNALRPTDFKENIINFLYNCFKINSDFISNHKNSNNRISISEHFSKVVSKMFSRYGLVMFDPGAKELKNLANKILKFDVNNYERINKIINDTGFELERKGYHSQLKFMDKTVNFFWNVDNVREKISPAKNGAFYIKKNKVEREKLLEYIDSDVRRASLNVVLRPLFQDSIFPVICSVCGSGEVSYFSQLGEVYDLAGMKLPVIYPRFSATIVEKKIKKILDKMEISYNKLATGRENLTSEILKNRLNINLDKIILEIEKDISEKIKQAEKNILLSEMNVSASFDRIKRNMRKEINVLKKKLYSEYRNQNEYIGESIGKVFLNLFPNDNLQEREISVWSYINRYGFELLDSLYSKFQPFDFTHKFIEII